MQQRLRAERILGWLAFAYRPLKAWEICDGLVLNEGSDLNDESKLGAGILNICKPLIEEREGGVVALVHFSAREYVFNGSTVLLELTPGRYLLHRMSGPYISRFEVDADVTSACLRYLLTCGPSFTSVNPASNHDQIIKGFHDIFPYVYEFWHHHLQNYSEALRTQTDDEKRMRKVQVLLSTFASSQSQSILEGSGSDSGAAVAEHLTLDMESDALRAFPPIVREYIACRTKMSIIQNSAAKELDSDSDLSHIDPTWISAVYRNYQRVFESLLFDAHNLDYHRMRAKYHQMTVSLEDIQKFKVRHGKSAYLCRWNGCAGASVGFQSIAEREKHETAHKQQFRCSDPSCDFANNGFSSRRALRKHNLKYHIRAEDHDLPNFVNSEDQSIKRSGTSEYFAPLPDDLDFEQYLQSPGGQGYSHSFDLNGDVLENFDSDPFLQSCVD